MPPRRRPPSPQQPLPNYVIRVGGAVGVLTVLTKHGIDPDEVAREVGLRASVFADPDAVVPFATLCRFVHVAAQRTGLSDLGHRACTETGLPALGLVGYLVANMETVQHALAALQEYLFLHDQGATLFFVREGSSAVLGYEVLTPGIPGADQVTFGALTIMKNLLTSLCGDGFRLQEVTVARPAPADTSSFRTFFGAPVRFSAARSAVAFDARWLGQPVRSASTFIRNILAERVHDQVADARLPEERIRRVVRTLIIGGKFSVDDVAAAFGMNRRTFARRLDEHGTSFRKLLDEARYQSAQNLLRSSGATIAEVAARLGYSETATFTRAFRRWSGNSPRQWRQEQ